MGDSRPTSTEVPDQQQTRSPSEGGDLSSRTWAPGARYLACCTETQGGHAWANKHVICTPDGEHPYTSKMTTVPTRTKPYPNPASELNLFLNLILVTT